ncbi:hypothetical protein BXO88_11045 [Oribacterium sp. C9]|uniref:hypothetical protein n=1 Tax=Oribacterium sp. C9 TaxID=1943579 RepID=UPI00098EE742|nr:hypothetical protein [Oribacterium sp. C9]OON85784.1 hypothetical protein BXO88_11045 [Oribacterium sp. C9]
MYSDSIKDKVNTMFDDLKKRVYIIVSNSNTATEAAQKVTNLASSELASRSKSLLSDMLFDLSDSLMNTDYFKDISKQNRFTEINLRQEILSKYQFAATGTVNYNETSRETRALKVGGITFVIGGVSELGYVLISGLSLSSLFPIPIGTLIAVSIGTALTDYYAIEPKREKKAMLNALNDYFEQAKKQFIDWFDEVERYFNMRVEEIKCTI